MSNVNTMTEDRRKEETKKLKDALTEFVLVEIGGNAIDGITYTLLDKNNKNDADAIKRYKKIKEKAISLGYTDIQLFREYPLSNGYIFDMDMDQVKAIIRRVARELQKQDPEIKDVITLISENPEKRRVHDMKALASYIFKKYNEGLRTIEVALFSKNSTNKITITGKGPDGSYCQVHYNAYALRHWDIEMINEKLLRPKGIKIRSLEFCEILPSKTGVSVKMGLEMAG